VEEVEEGSMVHGGRGPSRGGSRGIGRKSVCEGKVGEDAGRGGLGLGVELGIARCIRPDQGRAARGGPADLNEPLDAETSFGRRCGIKSCGRAAAGGRPAQSCSSAS
jgi:hypothetical protein